MTTQPSRREAIPRFTRFSPALAAALLAGCISFGNEPPEQLFTLSAEQHALAGTQASTPASEPIAVLEPEARASLDVMRIPVRIDETSIAYLADAFWEDKPARLFRRLLAETLRAGGQSLVIDGDIPEIFPERRLGGSLREFGYDARTRQVTVRFDALLHGKGNAVRERRFEASESGIDDEPAAVAAALNRAANEVARQIAQWVSAG